MRNLKIKYIQKLQFLAFAIFAVIMAFITIGNAEVGGSIAAFAPIIVLFSSMDLMKAQGNPGASKKLARNVYYVLAENILTMPARDANKVTLSSNIVLKNGKYWKKVESPKNVIMPVSVEGDPSYQRLPQWAQLEYAGDNTDVRTFIANLLGADVIVLIQHCGTGEKTVIGTTCNPCVITMDGEGGHLEDKTGYTFQFRSESDLPPAFYTGTFATATPTVVPADDATPDVAAGEGQYQLTDGSAAPIAITSLDNAVHNTMYTLLGSGGDFPSTITASSTMVLKDGTTWTATAGAYITLKAYKSGASAFVFYETARG